MLIFQSVPIPAHEIDVGSILMVIATVSVAVNGFFLRSVARRIETIDARQQAHADRLTWLEAHSPRTPRRRKHDISGDYFLPPDDEGEPA